MHRLRLFGIAALATAAMLPAQGMRSLVPTAAEPGMLVWDGMARRIVRVGRQTEVAWFDGSRWIMQPGSGPPLLGRMVWRAAAGEIVAFGRSFDARAETWTSDGGTWMRRNSTPPPPRDQFGLAYDSARDRVVLFGGADTAIYGDTWEWNGSSWSQRGASGPGPRLHPHLAFDSLRGVTVLFGGQQSGAATPSDTWEWNGTSWHNRSTPQSPPGRTQASFAYDPFRARAVLTGGVVGGTGGASANDVWEYDGANWTRIVPTSAPAPRFATGFVFDDARGECVLVGGGTASATDAWSWDGRRWFAVSTPPSMPAGDHGAVAAAEPQRGGILLFGSLVGNATLRYRSGVTTIEPSTVAPGARIETTMWSDGGNTMLFGGLDALTGAPTADTWRWTSVGWLPSPGPQPPPRQSAAAAYDRVRGKSVLFGGVGASGNSLDDTWEFDGTTWSRRTPSHRPVGRSQHALAWLPTRGRVVLFGGTAANRTALDDTWEFDGVDWTAVATATRPPALGTAAMDDDPRLGRLVMTTAQPSASTAPTAVQVWTFDGVAWARLALDEARYITARHSVCFDTANGDLLVAEASTVMRVDAATASAHLVGVDCGPQSPSIRATTYPSLGNPDFGVDLARATPGSIAVLALSPNGGATQLFGCTLLLGQPITAVMAAVDSRGFAHVPVPLPGLSLLLGSDWFFQAATPRPGSASGIAFSTALTIVVGR